MSLVLEHHNDFALLISPTYDFKKGVLTTLIESCIANGTIEEFSSKISSRGIHWGFAADAKELELLLQHHKDKVSFVNHKRVDGFHMGFGANAKKMKVLLEHCGDKISFLNHLPNSRKNISYYCEESSIPVILENCGDPMVFLKRGTDFYPRHVIKKYIPDWVP